MDDVAFVREPCLLKHVPGGCVGRQRQRDHRRKTEDLSTDGETRLRDLCRVTAAPVRGEEAVADFHFGDTFDIQMSQQDTTDDRATVEATQHP